MKKYFAAAVLLLTMTACGGGPDKALEGTTWKLTRMDGIPASAIDREARFFTMEFNAADTMVAGRTNCNRFFGRYELRGTRLQFGPLGMTRMACPDMEHEATFVRILELVDGFEINGSELTLLGHNKPLAVFKAAKEPITEDLGDAERL